MNIVMDYKKAKTKLPRVMRAAVHLFVRKGIDGTTIKEIAREAKVAEGALYRHFKSKDELAWHLFSASLNQFTADLMAQVYAEAGAQARIRRFVEESFAAFEADRDLFTYLILREHGELKKYSQSYLHPGHVAMKIIEDGQKAGEIRPGEPLLLGSLFIGGIIRICVVKMYGDLREDLRKDTAEVSEMLWAMLRVPQPANRAKGKS